MQINGSWYAYESALLSLCCFVVCSSLITCAPCLLLSSDSKIYAGGFVFVSRNLPLCLRLLGILYKMYPVAIRIASQSVVMARVFLTVRAASVNGNLSTFSRPRANEL